MAWWVDGSTNQIILAEKFVPGWAVDKNVAGDEGRNANRWYGSIMMPSQNDNEGHNVARTISDNGRLFALGPNDPNWQTEAHPDNNSNEALGSCHPGIVNILLGDGSVRAVPITTPPITMWRLTCVDDGGMVTLP